MTGGKLTKAQERVEAELGDRVICQQCGATLATYADACSVPLDVRCEGFETVEAALSKEPTP